MALYEFDGKIPFVPSDSFVHPDAVLIGDVKIGHECLIAPELLSGPILDRS